MREMTERLGEDPDLAAERYRSAHERRYLASRNALGDLGIAVIWPPAACRTG